MYAVLERSVVLREIDVRGNDMCELRQFEDALIGFVDRYVAAAILLSECDYLYRVLALTHGSFWI